MKGLAKKLAIAATLVLVTGCAPEPKDVCQHMMDVMENDPEKPGFLEDMDKCVDRMENVKLRAGVNSYRREVECALGVDTAYKMRTCIQKEEKKRNGKKV